jgi:hypothetical protein
MNLLSKLQGINNSIYIRTYQKVLKDTFFFTFHQGEGEEKMDEANIHGF